MTSPTTCAETFSDDVNHSNITSVSTNWEWTKNHCVLLTRDFISCAQTRVFERGVRKIKTLVNVMLTGWHTTTHPIINPRPPLEPSWSPLSFFHEIKAKEGYYANQQEANPCLQCVNCAVDGHPQINPHLHNHPSNYQSKTTVGIVMASSIDLAWNKAHKRIFCQSSREKQPPKCHLRCHFQCRIQILT